MDLRMLFGRGGRFHVPHNVPELPSSFLVKSVYFVFDGGTAKREPDIDIQVLQREKIQLSLCVPLLSKDIFHIRRAN